MANEKPSLNPCETNLLAWFRAKYSLDGHTSFENDRALWGYSSRKAGLCTIAKCHFEEESVRQDIDDILRSYQQENSFANILYGPSSTPINLKDILRKERHCMGPRFLPGMVLELRNLQLVGWVGERISDASVIREKGYPAALWQPKDSRKDATDIITELMSKGLAHTFGAFIEGELASSATLCISDGIAGIYEVVTKKEFRKRGGARAAVNAALGFAKDLNCDSSVLHSYSKVTGLYEKLGYQNIGNFTSMYYSRTRMESDRETGTVPA